MKRIISVLMIVCLMASFCTLSAFADNETATVTNDDQFEGALLGSYSTIILEGEGPFTVFNVNRSVTIKFNSAVTKLEYAEGYVAGDMMTIIDTNGGVAPIDDLGGGAGGSSTEPGAGGGAGSSTVAEVATAEELLNAVANQVSNIKLMANIPIDTKLNILVSTYIDGNNKTLTYNGSDRAIDVRMDTNGANLTIDNLKIDCPSSYTQRGITYNTTGKLTLNNVTISGENITYAVNMPTYADGSRAEINNCSLSANIALNIWCSDAVINVSNSTLTSVDNSKVEGYAAISLSKDKDNDAANTVVNVNGGSITATDDSAAIRIGATNGHVNVNGATVTGPSIIVVASISYPPSDNSYSFTSLAEAIEFAKSGETVELLNDVDLGGKNIEVTKDITINQNGHSIKNGYVIFPDGSKLGSAPAAKPAVSNPYAVPATGDMSNMPLWAVLFVGFAAVAVLTRKKKA